MTQIDVCENCSQNIYFYDLESFWRHAMTNNEYCKIWHKSPPYTKPESWLARWLFPNGPREGDIRECVHCDETIVYHDGNSFLLRGWEEIPPKEKKGFVGNRRSSLCGLKAKPKGE